MRILLLGKGGQLGWEANRSLTCLGEVIALDYPEIDFSQPNQVRDLVLETHPDVIYNAVAYTAVDRAEQETEKARLINAITPGILAETAQKINAGLIHISTDYVFDGSKGDYYIESDPPAPVNFYGKTKLEGEQAVLSVGGAVIVLRTSWMYSLRPESFVGKVLSWSRQQTALKIVDDQIGSPTWARLFADVSACLLAQGTQNIGEWMHQNAGLYHLAGGGAVSRMEWAQAILSLDPHKTEQICQSIVPGKTVDFPTPAARPLYTPLNCKKFSQTFGLHLGDWYESLKLAMA